MKRAWRNARRLPPALVEQLCSRYTKGSGVVQLARDYGVHRDTVNRHLRASGVQLRSTRALTDEQEDQICDRYSVGESCAAIAGGFGVDPETLANALRRRGMKLRLRNGST